MNRTIICPHCGISIAVKEEQGDAVDDVACENCRGRLLADDSAPVCPTTVLCIDDDPLVLLFCRDLLERRGYRVLTVPDGLAGVALAQQERPDVILLDVMLRGLSGYDICRKLRAEPTLHTTPIILLTVWDHPSVAATGGAAGATAVLHKPADPEVILSIIERVLSHERGSPRR